MRKTKATTKAKVETPAPSKIVAATGIAVGRNNEEKTPLGVRLEAAMHQAIMQGRDKGENDVQIKARIDVARDEVLNAE